MRYAQHRFTSLIAAVALCSSAPPQAGEWGSGKWGRMYWGANPESGPTVAPIVAAESDGTDIALTITNLLTGEEVGWSAITRFEVACAGLDAVSISPANPRLSNLEPDTEYTCSIVAINEVNGVEQRSPSSSFTASTDSQGGLPVWLIYQATQQG